MYSHWKMLVIFCFLSIANNTFAKTYGSCGQDKNEALDDLVSQISVTVESKYEESASMHSKGADQRHLELHTQPHTNTKPTKL